MIPEPDLDANERAAFERGLREFDEGLFFECHDTLEELWSGLRGPSRDFFQGLIQVSVAFYHLDNGNLGGAGSMLERAGKRLAAYPGRYYGFDLDALRSELGRWLAAIRAGDVAALRAMPRPRWKTA